MNDVFSIVVTPLVEEIIKDAKDLIKHEYQLLKGVDEDVKKLTSILTSIQSVLQDAERKQNESLSVRDWLGKLQEFVFDSEDVLDVLATEASTSKMRKHSPFSTYRRAYKLNAARAIKELLERLDGIEKEKANFHLDVNTVVSTSPTPLNRTTSYVVHESDMVGRDSDKNNIVDMLLSQDSDLSVIPIFGMGGLGKTTLAQYVYNDDRVKSHFGILMWVRVTVNYDHRKILKDMIEYHSKMRFDVDSLSDSQLVSRLLEFLKGNRFLLVLDDVWNDSLEDWKKLENMLRDGGKGSKVIVTTRFMSVSRVMGTKSPYLLQHMPEVDCWSLFKKITFPGGNYPVSSVQSNLENIGREIVQKCRGLPLAVRAMGGLLRGDYNEEKWNRILQHDIWEADEYSNRTGKPVILPALRLSYDHLPSHHLKQCFAYCCIFPKGHVFHKMELIKLWKAASLIPPRETYKLDDIGSDYFDELLSRSLLQVSSIDNKVTYRMHDLIHDLALSVSAPYYYQIRDNHGRSSIPEKARHLAMLYKDAQPHIMDELGNFKKLRTLVSPVGYPRDFRPALNKLFKTWNCLRTLDLSSSIMTELPESVGELKLLCYLDLSKTEIRRLPNTICKLYNLQTLKLFGCLWLFELPKDFGNLVNLEHLELDDMFWHKSLTLPSNMGRLEKLQNLHVFQLGDKQGYGIDELKGLLNLKGSLHISRLENGRTTLPAYLKDKESLSKVVYEWSSRDGSPQDEAEDREMLESLQPHPNIEEINILHYLGNRFPSWLTHSSVQKLTSLSLKHCKNCRILSLGDLPHLTNLSLKGFVELEEWSDARYVKLHRLNISSCPKLKQVPSHFLNLNVMKIKKCDSIEALPLTPFLMFLTLVDNPGLKDFNEQWVRFVSINGQGERRTGIQPSFRQLLEMKVINCSQLPQLPEEFAPQKLEIIGCPQITALPTSRFAGRLQHLAIKTCEDGSLVKTIPETSSLYSLVISSVRNLSSLPELSHLPGLKALYIHGCNELISLSSEEEPFRDLKALQLLSIRECHNLETLPGEMLPSSLTCLTVNSCSRLKSLGSLMKLTSLKDLYIEHCPGLESLPNFPTSLQHLRVEGCPLLMSRCHEPRPDRDKIMNIPDLELESNEVSSDKKSRTTYPQFICCIKGQNIK